MGKHEEKHEWDYGDKKKWQLEGDPKVQSPIEIPKNGGADPLPARYVRMQVEIHFVHKSAENDSQAPGWRRDLAVVGVFFKEGAHNPALEMVWKD